LGIVIGILTWIQLTLLGIDGALPLAIFTGFISLIPTLGGIIALIPLAIVPLLQGSTVFIEMSHITVALLVVGINLVISQLIWNVVAPKMLGDALNLPMPVMIVGVFIGAAIGGILGAFLVAPIMSMISVIVGYVIAKVSGFDPYPGEIPESRLGNQDWR
jgi:predicted PurR-regulated permease PerM